MTIGAYSSPDPTISLNASPGGGARRARPSRCAPAGPGTDASRAPCRASCAGAVVGNKLLDLRVGAVDVLGVPGQRDPAEGADAAAEQRPDVGGHEAGEVERVLDPVVAGDLADVVAVVEYRDAHALKAQQVPDMVLHRRGSGRGTAGSTARRRPTRRAPALRQIAVDGIVRRRLVGHASGRMPRASRSGEHVDDVAEQRRPKLAAARPAASIIASASSSEPACTSR